MKINIKIKDLDSVVECGLYWAWWHCAEKINNVWRLWVEDPRNDQGEIVCDLDTPKLTKALECMLMSDNNRLGEIAARILNGNFDNSEADVFLQMCVFGQINYA